MPASASAVRMPSSPITNAERHPRPARSSAVAPAEVTTSSGEASTPAATRRSATAAGVRAELFVTNAMPRPASRRAATASGAPGIGSAPRYSTPSRSNRKAS